MDGLDLHAAEVINPLNPARDGIPWFAITDADGKVLATSDGPLGNIGMPDTTEELRQLRETLSQVSQRLTPAELDQLTTPATD